MSTRFSSATKIPSSRDFRCSPKATDKPNMAANIRQNHSAGTEFTFSRGRENGVRIRLLTSDKSRNFAI